MATKIVEINGTAVAPDAIPELVWKSAGKSVTLTVERQNQNLQLAAATPSAVEGLDGHLGFTLCGGGDVPVFLPDLGQSRGRLQQVLANRSPVLGVRG